MSTRAFVSHSSRNDDVAAQVEKELEARGLEAWVDSSEIRLGALLSAELQDNIRASRALVLLWSEHAAASRWVHTEWIMAIHESTFIVPCALDATELPQCLQNTVHLRIFSGIASVADQLARAVCEAPLARNPLAPVIRAEEAALKEAIATIYEGQNMVLEQLQKRKLEAAEELQELVGDQLAKAEKLWRLDPVIANLGGYQRKNAYTLKHWDAIQSGRAPADPLLTAAENRYFESLSVDPTDPSALNGIGNVFFYGRDLDAAEAFHTWAIRCAEERGIHYQSAIKDRELVRRHKPRG